MWDIAERVLIAIITAGVTVRLSLRNFSTQKWWEKQAEVYSAILESLSHMKHYIDDYLRREETHESIPAERRELLFRRWRDSKDRIEQVTHVGAFIISDDAEAHLKTLRRELDAADKGDNDWYGTAGREWDALDKCIKAIRECAREDLRDAGALLPKAVRKRFASMWRS